MPSAPRRNQNPASDAGMGEPWMTPARTKAGTVRKNLPKIQPERMDPNPGTNYGIGPKYTSGYHEQVKPPNIPPSMIGRGRITPSDKEAWAAAAHYTFGDIDMSNAGEDLEDDESVAAFRANQAKNPTPVPPSRTLVRGYAGGKTTFGDNEKALIRTAEQAELMGPTTVNKQVILAGEDLSEEAAEKARREVYMPEIRDRIYDVARVHYGVDLSGVPPHKLYDAMRKLGIQKQGGTYIPGKQVWDSPAQQVGAAETRKYFAHNAASLLHPSEVPEMNPEGFPTRPTGTYRSREQMDPRGYVLYADDPYAAEKQDVAGFGDSAAIEMRQTRDTALATENPDAAAEKREARLAKMRATTRARRAAAKPQAEPAPVVEMTPAPATKTSRPRKSANKPVESPAPAKAPSARKASGGRKK